MLKFVNILARWGAVVHGDDTAYNNKWIEKQMTVCIVKKMIAMLLLLIILIVSSSCDGDLTTPEERQAAIQEAGDVYGLNFEITYEIPYMPAGALFVFESDEFKKSVTEVYECYFDHDTLMDVRAFKNTYNNVNFIHVDTSQKVIVAQGFPGFVPYYPVNSFMYEFYKRTTFEEKEKAIPYVSHSYWVFEKLYNNRLKDTQATYDYILETKENPASPLHAYHEDMTPDELDHMFYAAVHEDDTIYPRVYDQKLDPVKAGNRYEKSEIPEDAWIVFNIPNNMIMGNYPEKKKEIIRGDLLFLLDTYYKELH